MTELVLAVYGRADSAEHVLDRLRSQSDELPVDFESAATVRIGMGGVVTVTTRDLPGSGDSLWGMLWEALFGLIFLVPAPGTAYGSNLGALFGAIDRAGVDASFRSDARRALGPGTSGLGFLVLDGIAEPIFRQLHLRPEVLLRASIVLDQNSDLMRELGGGAPRGSEGEISC